MSKRRGLARTQYEKYRGMYEAVGGIHQRVLVSGVAGGHVFFQLEPQGSKGHMPTATFKKHYRKIRMLSRHGDAITPQRARVVRESEDRFERAREAHDPKRYKRGGGYTPEEYKTIAKRAGISRAPTNRAKEALAVHEFMRDKPEHVFAYYSNDMRTVQLWSKKSTVGDIVWRGARHRRMGGEVQAIRVRGYNGVMYHGICNLTGGTYCRLRRMSSTRSR